MFHVGCELYDQSKGKPGTTIHGKAIPGADKLFLGDFENVLVS